VLWCKNVVLRLLWMQWRDIRHPWYGGAEVYMHEILSRISKKGFEVIAITSGFRGLKRLEHIDGYSVLRVGGHETYLFHAVKALLRYVRWADVVVEDTSKVPLFLPLLLGRFGKPVIAIAHHLNREIYFEELSPLKAWIAYDMESLMPRLYTEIPNTRFAAVSQSTCEELIELGAKPNRIAVVPNGVDVSKYKPETCNPMNQKSEEPTVLYLSRLKRYKRPLHALYAFKLISRDVPEAKLIIAGDGELKGDVERSVKELALEDRVQVLGRVKEEEKIRLLQRAWVLIQTSRKEGFGLTVLEAAACGTPTIAYENGGFRNSIKDAETGLLVPQGNVKALALAILNVLADEELREKLTINAVRWAREFTWERSTKAFMGLVRECVER